MLLLVKKLTIKIAAIATAAVLVAGLIFGGAFKLGQHHQQTHSARPVKNTSIDSSKKELTLGDEDDTATLVGRENIKNNEDPSEDSDESSN